MEKFIIAVLVMLSGIIMNGQEKQPVPTETKDYYLQKAKKQNTTAWVLLGGGAALAVSGAVIFGENFDLFSDDKNSGGGGLIIVAAGGLALLGSIPFFIHSSANKRKALAAPVTFNFKMEKGIDPWRQWKQPYYPAISMKLSFR